MFYSFSIDELETINKPMFGGARGEQFETKCDQIEHMFTNALDNVKSVSASILDVQAPSWYDDVLQFRSIIKDIEVRLPLQKAAKTEEQSRPCLLNRNIAPNL